jgi:hypothetical protein
MERSQVLTLSEDRYEALELIVKSRQDGKSWFDIIYDLIASNCQGSEEDACTCGLETMGGTGGSLDQCYKYIRIDDDKVEVGKEDLLKVLNFLDTEKGPMSVVVHDAAERMRKECTWWEDWQSSLPPDEEEE